jgi:hypoxanthine phosphoribosyltransferase
MSQTHVEVLYDAATVQAGVKALGERLDREIASEDPLVVSLLAGSVIFLADLVRAIRTPLRFAFIQSDLTERTGSVTAVHYPLPLDIRGQSLLVLKDVVASGIVETYLGNELKEHGATTVRFAALMDLPSERKTEFPLDYAVFTAQRTGTFVGYGLKQHGLHGSLPFLGRLSDS